jgi:lipopolysaccharide export system permease protein
MKLLDRYVARELLGPFLFGLALFITVVVSGEYLFKLTQFIAHGAPFLPVAELFGLRIVVVLVLCLPMAMLLAALLAFGRLSSDSELIAMQAGGTPVYRTAYSAVAFGLVLSVLGFLINEFIVPPAGRVTRRLEDSIIAYIRNELVRSASAGKAYVVQDFDGGQLARVVIARSFDPQAGRLKDVIFLQFGDGKLKTVVEAREAEWVGESQWRFKEPRFTAVGPVSNGGRAMIEVQDEAILTLNKTPEGVSRDIKDPDEMSYFELKDYIGGLRARKVPPTVILRLEVGLQNKLSMPFACLVFAVLGAPLGIRRQRSGAAVGVGISICILFAYYVLWHSMAILGENGRVPVVFSAWCANLLGLATGVVLLRRVSR